MENNSSDENLKKVQQLSLKCLRRLDEICQKYQITYYLDSGTLIGAIRHHSFIPWDDDIDIAFKREEYNKLLKVPAEEWGKDFQLVSYRKLTNETAFLDLIPRVIYTGETVSVNSFDKAAQSCVESYRNCVALDCFILDDAYDSNILQKILVLKLNVIYGLLMGHRDFININEYNGVSRFVVKFLSTLGKKFSLKKLLNLYEKISQSVPSTSKRVYYSNYTINTVKIVCEKDWYHETIKVPFGSEYFDAPIGYHQILSTIYGDYMTPPSEEERKPKHMNK